MDANGNSAGLSPDEWLHIIEFLIAGLCIVIWAVFLRVMNKLDDVSAKVSRIMGHLGLEE